MFLHAKETHTPCRHDTEMISDWDLNRHITTLFSLFWLVQLFRPKILSGPHRCSPYYLQNGYTYAFFSTYNVRRRAEIERETVSTNPHCSPRVQIRHVTRHKGLHGHRNILINDDLRSRGRRTTDRYDSTYDIRTRARLRVCVCV